MGGSLWLGLCLLIQGLVKTLFFVNLSKFGCQFLHAQKWLPISKMPCITLWNCKSWKTAIQIGTIQQTKQCWNISDFEWSLRSKSLRNCNWNIGICNWFWNWHEYFRNCRCHRLPLEKNATNTTKHVTEKFVNRKHLEATL